MDLALGGCEKIPMIRSNTFFVGSWGVLPKHEKLVCQHPFFCRELLFQSPTLPKSSGSPEVGACFFLGQMAHNQIYQIARNILPTKGEYICQNKLHLLDIYQYHHHHHYKNGIPNRSPTTARLQPHKRSLQEYDTRSPLFFETQRKNPRNLVGPTSIPTKGWFSYNIPGIRPFFFYNFYAFLRFVGNPTLPFL